MKKLSKMLALVLAMVMLLSVSALAAETIPSNGKATIKDPIDPISGAVVSFVTADDDKISVTYESTSVKGGQFYLVMVVADDGKGNYNPTQNTILYINQTTGVDTGKTDGGGNKIGRIEFTGNDAVYPSSLKNSAILIYGLDVNGTADSLIAAIIEMKFIIGDVDKSGEVDVGDATMLLRYLAGLVEDESTVNLAASDTDGSSEVDVGDATKLLRVLAGLTTM